MGTRLSTFVRVLRIKYHLGLGNQARSFRIFSTRNPEIVMQLGGIYDNINKRDMCRSFCIVFAFIFLIFRHARIGLAASSDRSWAKRSRQNSGKIQFMAAFFHLDEESFTDLLSRSCQQRWLAKWFRDPVLQFDGRSRCIHRFVGGWSAQRPRHLVLH